MAGRPAVSIAVVDDEAAVRRALARLLAAEGYAVSTFESGDAFFCAVPGATRPDCMIVDLHMPGMSGLELVCALQARDVPTPAIVITAYDEPESRERCLRAGAAAYLRKPLEGGVLLDKITELLLQPQSPAADTANG